MITVRKGDDRGYFDHGWLKTFHTFSFGNYYDPDHMGFRALRVINEDRVAPKQGFPPHGHQNMEIISFVLEGALAHTDSLGHTSTLKAGEIQVMSVGTGVKHAEFNPSDTEEVHFFQIWITPLVKDTPPSYHQQDISHALTPDQWVLIASRDGRQGSFKLHQEADLFAARLAPNKQSKLELASGRYGWLQVAKGKLTLNGVSLEAGDGAAIEQENLLQIQAEEASEVLFFDL